MDLYDVVVIGAGPAGMASALEVSKANMKVLIIERENRLGGILKQCIHDGFGLIKFKEKLSGPEYAHKYIEMLRQSNVKITTSTFITKVRRNEDSYEVTLINSNKGVFIVRTKVLILANGCRERTSKQVFIHGSRPAGVYTAGTAQYIVNIMGYLPCKRCVILGSGDIGLIMARRLTLEGAHVEGVYEVKSFPSGLNRNIAQCLEDYNIPLHLSHTVTRVIGDDRVEGVEICKVDNNMKSIKGSEKIIKCDGLILSVGLIPENEIAESIGVEIDNATKGPYIDQNFMTINKSGIFSCGNALHVNDLVDYVSESGEYAGINAVKYIKNNISKKNRRLIPIIKSLNDFHYVVPQYINAFSDLKKIIIYFRSKDLRSNILIQIKCKDDILFEKKFEFLRPAEMEKIEIDLSTIQMNKVKQLNLIMVEG